MRLRDLRENHGLSQNILADYLGICLSAYSQYENGHRSVSAASLLQLAKYYHTSVDYLLGLTNEKKPYPTSKSAHAAGERLRELREKHHLSQKNITGQFQVSQSACSQYENGQRTISAKLLARFAEYFDVSVDYLLGATDSVVRHPLSKDTNPQE